MTLEVITGGLAAEKSAAKKVRMKLAAFMEMVDEAERAGVVITMSVGNTSLPLTGNTPYLKMTVNV